MVRIVRVAMLCLALLAACSFEGDKPVWPNDCAPFTVPVAGWKAPYSVTVGDSVRGWYQTEREALLAAVATAKEEDRPVRIAAIVEVRFLRDGETCTPVDPPQALRA